MSEQFKETSALLRRIDRRDFLKIASLTAGATAIGGALAACGAASPSPSGSAAAVATSGATAVAASAGPKVTLPFTYWGSPVEKDAVDKAAAEFSQISKLATIDAQHIDNAQYGTKMNTLVAANQQPVLAYLTEGMAMRLGEQGHLVNILEYRDKYPELADLLPGVIHQWAPGEAVTQLAVEMMLLIYNADVFAEAGVPVPPARADQAWTWDEFVQTADKLTVDANGKHPSEDGFDAANVVQYGTVAPQWIGHWYALLRSNDADIVDETGEKSTIDSDGAQLVLKNITDLIHDHRVAPSPQQMQTIGGGGIAALLKSRRVAMQIEGQWALLDLGKAGFNYGLGVLPKFQVPTTINLCNALAIFKGDEDPEAAIEFMLHLSNPEKVNLYSEGLWMPLQNRYYTDPAIVAGWTENPAHPEQFKDAALDAMLNHSVAFPSYRLRDSDAVFAAMTPPLDLLWTGESRDVAAAAAESARKMAAVLAGVYPDVLTS